jgi:hypothetical protein
LAKKVVVFVVSVACCLFCVVILKISLQHTNLWQFKAYLRKIFNVKFSDDIRNHYRQVFSTTPNAFIQENCPISEILLHLHELPNGIDHLYWHKICAFHMKTPNALGAWVVVYLLAEF